MKKLLVFGFAAFTAVASTFVSKQAFAHSDYWRCAAAAGSPERAIALCGVRGGGAYDRNGDARGGWGRPGPAYPGRGGWDRGPRGPFPGGGWDRGPRGPHFPGRGGWGRGPGRRGW